MSKSYYKSQLELKYSGFSKNDTGIFHDIFHFRVGLELLLWPEIKVSKLKATVRILDQCLSMH
jgi:hypothetical protein